MAGNLISVEKCIAKFFKHVSNFDCAIALEISEGLFGQLTIYVLQCLVEKYLSKEKGPSVQYLWTSAKHLTLCHIVIIFYSLLNAEMYGRIINVLRHLYHKLRA